MKARPKQKKQEAYEHTTRNGEIYELYSCEGANNNILKFFARKDTTPSKGVKLDSLPEGFTVIESEKTGMPMLKSSQK